MASPNFVYAWRLLSGSKADLIPLGARNPRNFYTADGDHTPLLQSLDDIRYGLISGSLFGFAPQANTPSATSGSAYNVFVTGSTGDLFYNKNGTLIRITLGSGLGSDVVSASVDYVGGIQIDTGGSADGQVLRFNGTKFVPATLTGSTVSSYPILTGTLFLTSVMTGSNALFSNISTAQLTASDALITKLTASFVNSQQLTSSNDISVQGIRIAPVGSANGHVLRYNGSAYVPATLTGSGGASTLSGSYAAGTTSADSIVLLTTALSGVILRDARPTISGSGGGGGTLFGIQDRPGTKKYLDVVVSGTHLIKSDMGEIAGGPAFVLDIDTDASLAVVSSRWLRFKNAGVVQGGFGFHPNSATLFGWKSELANTFFIASDNTGLSIQSAVSYFYVGNTAYVTIGAGTMTPFADLGTGLGDSAHRWSTTYTKAISADVSTLTASCAAIDSATAVALSVDTTNQFVSKGARLLSLRTAGAELSSIRPSGSYSAHFVGSGSTPTIAAGANAGSTSHLTITGSDSAFHFSVEVGAGTSAGEIAVITFARPFEFTPVCIVSGQRAASLAPLYDVVADTDNSSTHKVSIRTGQATVSGSTYFLSAICLGKTA